MTKHPYRELADDPPFSLGAAQHRGVALPLQRADIHARLHGVHAHVVLEQHYRNDRDDVLEVVYVFPAPALGAITSYTFAIDGVATRGVLMEREEARVVYDDAIAAGHAASTLEEERPEVMTVRIGNLAPGQTARIRIGIDLLLPIADDCVALRLPLVVGARYVPGWPLGTAPAGDGTAPDTDAAPDASRVTPPTAHGDPGVRVGVVVDAFDTDDVLATHPVTTDRRAGGLRVTLAEVVPDRDVVLRFPLRQTDAALFVRDAIGDEGTLVVTTCLAADADAPPPLDLAVIVDRSGSMDGAPMVAARRAAAGIVESLTPRDRIVVAAFDHELELPVGAALVTATAGQRRRALDALEALEARGGTELVAPLELAAAAFAGVRDRDRRRAIVLVTDALVANEDQLVGIVRRLGVEVLAVAIGPAANQGLCQRLAQVTGGAYEAAESPAVLGGALDRTLRRLLAPALDALDLAIEGAALIPGTRAPRRPPRAVAGVPAVLAARVRGTPSRAVVHAVDPRGTAIERAIAVSAVDAPALRRVWARLRIRDLEDTIAAAELPEAIEREDELVETSLAFGVLSRYTAFVAVDPRRTVDRAAPRARIVQPVMAVRHHEPRGAAPTQAGVIRGKFAYLSPEQCKGLPLAPASDVFALAVILHELATLQRLFRGEHDMDTVQRIIRAEVPPCPPALAAIEPILRRALAADPAARYADAGELARALAAVPSDRGGLAALAKRHARPRALRGPIRGRSRALHIAARYEVAADAIYYAAVYGGPLADALPDALVRVPSEYGDNRGDPLPIDDPHVARLLGVATVPRRMAVVEHVAGVDLRQLARALGAARTPLTPLQVAAIAHDAALGLAAIHARGLVHRRLDPGSFVLATTGRCILVDLPTAPPGTRLPPLPVPVRGLTRYLD